MIENFIKHEILSSVSSSTYLYPGCKLLQQFQRFATWTFLDINYSFYQNKRKFYIRKKIQISQKKKIQFLVTLCLKYHKYNVYSTLKGCFSLPFCFYTNSNYLCVYTKAFFELTNGALIFQDIKQMIFLHLFLHGLLSLFSTL